MLREQKIDALDYITEKLFAGAKTTIEESKAENALIDILQCISDNGIRNKYVAKYAKKYKIEKATVEKGISLAIAERAGEDDTLPGRTKLPAYLTQEDIMDFMEYGFYEDRKRGLVGYHFANGTSSPERVSNFIMKPLFQVKGLKDSNRFIEIVNAFENKSIIEISNKALVNQQLFEEIITQEGNFWFFASKRQYQKIRIKLLDKFPFCTEIRTLGWHHEGFYSFANGIVIEGQFKQVDQMGLVNFGDKKFFLPAFSSIYKDAAADDDMYENDRKFIYKSGNHGFQKWAHKFYSVYKDRENGMISVAFVVASLFSDFIFAQNNDFPLLFMFGLPGTGKTTCARSISRVFKADSAPFNLNQGTVIAFQRRLARARNVIEHLDEYQNDLDEKRFQSLKGLFDRTSHEKGIASRDNRTESIKVNATVVVSGQYFPTRDQNSFFSRIILLEFVKGSEDFTKTEKLEFQELNKMETSGLSDIIVEVIRYRSLVEEEFISTQFELSAELNDGELNEPKNGRVFKNIVMLMSLVKILEGRINFPFTFQEFRKVGIEMIRNQSKHISDSDQLAEFFAQLEFLSLTHMIKNKEDYKVEYRTELKVGRKDYSHTHIWAQAKQILFIKFSKVFPLYQQNMLKQGAKNVLSKLEAMNHMKTHKAFLGSVAVIDFETQSSGYAFDYKELHISLIGAANDHVEKPEPSADAGTQPVAEQGEMFEKSDDGLPF